MVKIIEHPECNTCEEFNTDTCRYCFRHYRHDYYEPFDGRYEICSHCRGDGEEDDSDLYSSDSCLECNGTGRILVKIRCATEGISEED